MKKTARTAWVEETFGWIMPYFFATSMLTSSMTGNVTSGFLIPFQDMVWIFLSHAIWEYRESTERPTSSVFMALNSSIIDANVMNSVVHTGVKSAGCENRTTHFPL